MVRRLRPFAFPFAIGEVVEVPRLHFYDARTFGRVMGYRWRAARLGHWLDEAPLVIVEFYNVGAFDPFHRQEFQVEDLEIVIS